MKYKHTLDNFADLANVVDQIITTTDKPAKTRYEQQAKKMNYRQVKEAKNNIDVIRDIVGRKQAKPIKFKDGQIKVDLTTANFIVKVFDKLNSKNQAKFSDLANGTKADFMKLHGVVMKLLKNSNDLGEAKAPQVSNKKFQSVDKMYTVLLRNYESTNEDVQEGKLKDIVIDFEDGVSDAKIAKTHDVSIQVIRGLRKDWKSMGEEVNEVSLSTADIKKEFPRVGDPKSRKVLQALINLHGYATNLKSYNKNPKSFVDNLKNIGKNDASLKKAGLTKRDIGEDAASRSREVSDLRDKHQAEIAKEREDRRKERETADKERDAAANEDVGKIKSRKEQVKERHEHAKKSPFKLKSEQYPRAIAINSDGFGKRHATIDDIVLACESFGMIEDKELQIEQIDKQLGKKGFISYKKSDLDKVFEDREIERMLLHLESEIEEQTPIEYSKEEIQRAQDEDLLIEFLRPDGYKSVGPILKMSGKTYNVKDRHTGKSYTYKYIEEGNQMNYEKSWTQPGEGHLNEGRFSPALIKKAIKIANLPKYKGGNYSGAAKEIEKLKKGLADDPKVLDALRKANEGNVHEYIQQDGTRRRVKERDRRLKDFKEAGEKGDKAAYQKFFNSALKKFGVSSPDELKGDKKKEFFDYVDKNWKADHESVDEGFSNWSVEVKSGTISGKSIKRQTVKVKAQSTSHAIKLAGKKLGVDWKQLSLGKTKKEDVQQEMSLKASKKKIVKEVPETSMKVDGRRKNFREKLMKLGYSKSQFK